MAMSNDYSDQIGIITGGPRDYDPDIIKLNYGKIVVEHETVYLLDCSVQAFVKFKEYLYWLCAVAGAQSLVDISDTVINRNGVDIHAIISDVYDEEMRSYQQAYENDPEAVIFDELVDITMPIMSYKNDTNYMLSKVLFIKPVNEFEYKLYINLGTNEWGIKEYIFIFGQQHKFDENGVRQCPVKPKPGRNCTCIEPQKYRFSLDDGDDALATLQSLVQRFKSL
jgi:hypothetical protein